MNPVRILIVDDHELIREALKRILFEGGAAREIAEAGACAEALQSIRRERWSLIILDLNLPDRSGLELLKDIKAEKPDLPVLVLSIVPEEYVAMRVLKAGADGFLSKASATEELVRAVTTILGGGRHVSPAIAARLIDVLRSPEKRDSHETLSDREDQVFRHIAHGETVSEIAAALRLSVKTVSSYRAHVLRKLQVENNAQLMSYAHNHGLLPHVPHDPKA